MSTRDRRVVSVFCFLATTNNINNKHYKSPQFYMSEINLVVHNPIQELEFSHGPFLFSGT